MNNSSVKRLLRISEQNVLRILARQKDLCFETFEKVFFLEKY